MQKNIGLAVLLAGTVCVGCAAPEKAAEVPEVRLAADPAPNLPRLSGSEEEFRQGRELGEKVLSAIRSGDIKNFEGAMPARLRKRSGQAAAYLKRFQAGSAELGAIKSVEYLGCMDQTVTHDHLWKVTFEKPVSRAGSGERELFRRTMLFQVSIVPLEGKLTIGNFRFL